MSGLKTPIIIQKDYANIPSSEFQLDSSTDLSSLLIDGLIDGLSLQSGLGQGLSNHNRQLHSLLSEFYHFFSRNNRPFCFSSSGWRF